MNTRKKSSWNRKDELPNKKYPNGQHHGNKRINFNRRKT